MHRRAFLQALGVLPLFRVTERPKRRPYRRPRFSGPVVIYINGKKLKVMDPAEVLFDAEGYVLPNPGELRDYILGTLKSYEHEGYAVLPRGVEVKIQEVK